MQRIHEMTGVLGEMFTQACERLEDAVAALPTKVAWPEGIRFEDHFGEQIACGTGNFVRFSGQTNASHIDVREWRTVLGEDGHVYAEASLGVYIEGDDGSLPLAGYIREFAGIGIIDLGETIGVGRMVPNSVLRHVVDYPAFEYPTGPCVRWGTREEAKAAQQALLAELEKSLAALS